MKELWKTIEFAPNYEVSNLGRVRNRLTKHILKQFTHSAHPNCVRVTLMVGGINKKYTVSQLVYNHWCLLPMEKPTSRVFYNNRERTNGKTGTCTWSNKLNRIGHWDDNVRNNRATNLYVY